MTKTQAYAGRQCVYLGYVIATAQGTPTPQHGWRSPLAVELVVQSSLKPQHDLAWEAVHAMLGTWGFRFIPKERADT